MPEYLVKLAGWHDVLVHFPIVLFTLTLICDIAYYLRKGGFFIVGSWLLWAGTFMCLPTLLTGWAAWKILQGEHPDMFYHIYFSIGLILYALLYSLLRLYMILVGKDAPPIAFLALSLILLGMTSSTSEYGRQPMHSQTPAN